MGQGPGEFAILMGYAINPHDNTLEILTPNRFLKYDLEFTLLKSTPLPTKIGKDGLLFNRIYDLSDSTHLLLPTPTSNSPNRVFHYNSSSTEMSELYSFDYAIICDQTMQTSCFSIASESDGKLWFTPPAFTGCVFGFDCATQTFTKEIRFNLHSNFINQSDLASLGATKEQQSGRIFSLSKEIPLCTFMSSAYIFLLSTTGPSLHDMKYYVLSKHDGACAVIDIYQNEVQSFPFIYYIDNEYAYAVMEKDILEDYSNLLMTDSNITTLAQIAPETLVLLKYRIKR